MARTEIKTQDLQNNIVVAGQELPGNNKYYGTNGTGQKGFFNNTTILGENQGAGALDTPTANVAQRIVPITSGSNVTLYSEEYVSGTIYVDATYGDDLTGLVERADKPFKSIDAAKTAAGTNSYRYFIAPGSYTLNSEFLLRSGDQIIGGGKRNTFITYTGTTGSAFRQSTVGTRIFEIALRDFELNMVYNAANTTVGIDFDQTSSSYIQGVDVSGFNVGLSLNSLCYYNNFYDLTLNSNGINIQVQGAGNENHFLGGRVTNGAIKQLEVTASNQIIFSGVSFEGPLQVIDILGGSEDIHFTNCRFESPVGSPGTFTFDAASRMNSIWHCRLSGPISVVDNNGGNTIYGGQDLRKFAEMNDNTPGFEFVKSRAGNREHSVMDIRGTYSAAGSPTIVQAMARRSGSKLFQGVYDNGTTKKATFRVNPLDGSVVMHSPDGNAWKISVSNAGAIVVTADTVYNLP